MLNQAFTAALREALAADPNNVDPRKFLLASRDAVKEVVRHKMRLFGSSGQVTAGGYRTGKTVHRSANIGGTEE
jgi:fructose-bisphosphate aldolase class II